MYIRVNQKSKIMSLKTEEKKEDYLHSGNGWNGAQIEDVGLANVLDNCTRTKYVLDCCERGVIIGHTSEDLVDHLLNLKWEIEDVIKRIEYNRSKH